MSKVAAAAWSVARVHCAVRARALLPSQQVQREIVRKAAFRFCGSRAGGRGGMKFVSFNIQYGFGLDGRYDLERAARAVAGADVIALQEVERNWLRSSGDDQPEILSRLLPDHYWVYGPAFDMDASLRDADGRLVNRRRQFGTMLMSRLPIVWSRLHLLPMRRVVRPLNTQNPALEGMIRTPSGPVRIFSIHLAHIGVEERLEQIAFLKALHGRVPIEGGPWSGIDDEPSRGWSNGEGEPEAPPAAIWMGDFNSEPGSTEHQAITGRSPYHPRAVYHDGFVDAVAACGQDPAVGHTHIRSFAGKEQKRRLDYCFVGATLASRVRSVRVDADCPASDHFPVWMDIDLETPGGGTSVIG